MHLPIKIFKSLYLIEIDPYFYKRGTLKFYDIFGEPVRVHINKEYTSKTNLGGFLFFLMIPLIATCTWLIGKDIIYREFPFSSQISLLSSSFKNITINTPILIKISCVTVSRHVARRCICGIKSLTAM